jgi:hypothetical protein
MTNFDTVGKRASIGGKCKQKAWKDFCVKKKSTIVMIFQGLGMFFLK